MKVRAPNEKVKQWVKEGENAKINTNTNTNISTLTICYLGFIFCL